MKTNVETANLDTLKELETLYRKVLREAFGDYFEILTRIVKLESEE